MEGSSAPHTRRAVVLCLLVLLSSSLPAVLGARTAKADLVPSPVSAVVDLRLDTFVAAEQAGDRLYVTGEPDRVLVLDLAGNELARMTVVDPGGLEVVGDTLLVASVSRGKIQRFDLTTTPPTRLDPLDVSAAGSPDDIAYANGRLWLTSEQDCNGPYPLWSVSLDGTDLQGYEVEGYLSCRALSTDPHAPGWLALVDPMHDVVLVDVSGAAPVATDTRMTTGCPPSFGPNADTFLLGPYEYSIASLAPLREFLSDDWRQCWALRVNPAHGGLVVGATGGTEIEVWSYDQPASPYAYFPLPSWRYGSLWGSSPAFDGTHGHSLLFGPDAQWLYAFMGYDTVAPTVKLVMLRPLERMPSLKLLDFGLDGYRIIKYGEELELRARLTGGTSAAIVRLYARPHGHHRWRLRGEATVDADGLVSFIVAPRLNTKYRFVYPGEEGWFPTTSTIGTVRVRVLMAAKLLRAAARDGAWRIYHTDQPVFYAAAVYPPYPGEYVEVDLYRYRDGVWRQIATDDFRQDRDGVIVVYVRAGALRPGRYRFLSWFEPSSHDREGNSAPYRYFRVEP